MHAGVKTVAADLQRLFGARLHSLVAYGDPAGADGAHTLALVERLTFQDLAACAPRVADWHRAGAAAPLLLTREEFSRTLDVFPLEYGDIIARHEVVYGEDVLATLRVNETDLRRACELQAKSHLIHLREGYLESAGNPRAISGMIAASAPSLAALLANLRRLDPDVVQRSGLDEGLVREIAAAGDTTIADPSPLFGRYLAAVERLWQEVDRWRA